MRKALALGLLLLVTAGPAAAQFTIPNYSAATYKAQAAPDSGDFGILAAAIASTGVVSGCAVTPQGTPDMTVAVAGGVVQVLGVAATVTAGNVTITPADTTHPRFDLVTVNASGVKSVVAGTPNVTPEFPTTSNVVLASIYVPSGATAIAAAQIIDKRAALTSGAFGLSTSGTLITSSLPIQVPPGLATNTGLRFGSSGLYGLWLDGTSINIRSEGHIQLAPLAGGVLPVNSAYTIGQAGTRWGGGYFLGLSSKGAGNLSEVYGLSATAAGEDSLAAGYMASASAWRSVAIGWKAQATAVSATAVGRGAVAAYTHSIAVGRGAWTNADNTLALGFSGGNSATDVYFESGHTHKYVDPTDGTTITRIPASTPIAIHGFDAYDATSSPTNDVAGGPLYLIGGRGTGTASGGNVVLQVAPAGGASNNTKNPVIDGLTVTPTAVTSSLPFRAPAGDSTSPGYAFTAQPGVGMFLDGTSPVIRTAAGHVLFSAGAGGVAPFADDAYTSGLSGNRWKNVFVSQAIMGSRSKVLTDAGAAVSIERVAVPTNGYGGQLTSFTVNSTDGTNRLTTTGLVSWAAADTGGTVTCGTPVLVALSTAYKRANTLVCTFTAATSTTNCDLQVTCTDDLAGAQTVTIEHVIVSMPHPNTYAPQ